MCDSSCYFWRSSPSCFGVFVFGCVGIGANGTLLLFDYLGCSLLFLLSLYRVVLGDGSED